MRNEKYNMNMTLQQHFLEHVGLMLFVVFNRP